MDHPQGTWTPLHVVLATWKQRAEAQPLNPAPDAALECGDCRGTGWKTSDHDAARVTRCFCWREGPIGVPTWLTHARLENCHVSTSQRGVIEELHRWIAAASGDLFLYGTVGVGKTHLAGAALNSAFLRGARGAAFVRVPLFFIRQLLAFDDAARKPEASRLFDLCCHANPLVLDDIGGGEKNSDFTRGRLISIYDHRLDRGLRTILTSNLNVGGVAAFYGDDRLASRIAGAARVIELTGEDQRVRNRLSIVRADAAKAV